LVHFLIRYLSCCCDFFYIFFKLLLISCIIQQPVIYQQLFSTYHILYIFIYCWARRAIILYICIYCWAKRAVVLYIFIYCHIIPYNYLPNFYCVTISVRVICVPSFKSTDNIYTHITNYTHYVARQYLPGNPDHCCLSYYTTTHPASPRRFKTCLRC